MSKEQYHAERECIASKRFQARDKAFADILNGPDTLTRRWLIGYLETRVKPKMSELLRSVPLLVRPNQGMEATKQIHGLFEAEKE